eukprot:68820-Rhodomonas_salina.3
MLNASSTRLLHVTCKHTLSQYRTVARDHSCEARMEHLVGRCVCTCVCCGACVGRKRGACAVP